MTGPAATNYAGKKHGAWRILRRNYDRSRGTYWNAMCACHRRGVLFAGDIARGASLACGTCTHEAARTGTSYRTAHRNVQRAHGKASAHVCVDCGRRAAQWSYTHDDADELLDAKTGCAYSLDVNHYAPRCTSCHRLFDEARKATS